MFFLFFVCVFNVFTIVFFAKFMLVILCHVGNTRSMLDEGGMNSTYHILLISRFNPV